MQRKEEKPISKTTANIMIGILISGLCLGMVKGCQAEEKSKQEKQVPVLNLKNKAQIER